MSSKFITNLVCASLLANFAFFAQQAHSAAVFSSLEQYKFQTGSNELTLRSYDGFDDYDGPVDSNGITGINGLSLSINGGASEEIPWSTQYDAYKRRKSWDTLNGMLAERPVDGLYAHTLSGYPSGTIDIQAPGHSYLDAIPANPLFTISGVNGTWSRNADGEGIFSFDPTGVTSFVVAMNRYSDSFRTGFQQGEHYVYSLVVEDIETLHSNIVASGTPDQQFVITFLLNSLPDAGDNDPTTFGFLPGSRFHLEGEFVNIFNYSTAMLGDVPVDHAFIYETVTNLLIHANPVPEPETYTLMLVGLGMIGLTVHRRRRKEP